MKKTYIYNLVTSKLRAILVIALILLGSTTSFAQLDTKGTDFYFMFNMNDVGTAVPTGGATLLSIFITSEVNTSGTVSIAGLGFSTPFNVVANTVTTVNIPIGAMNHVSDVVSNKAVHVVSTDDVSVYGLNRRGNTTDAFTALPTDILGTEYLYMNYQSNTNGHLLGIAATENGTIVTITPKINLGSHPANIPYSINMNAGDSYEILQITNGSELTGTVISSNKPIGVMGSNRCASIPLGVCCCDHIVEMLFPTSAWGKNFITLPLATRLAGDRWRILASDNATNVVINGTPQAPINAGQFIEVVLATNSIISSDKPVMLAQFSQSQFVDGVVSDPFMMLVMPVEQFLPSYTITTPLSGFPNNFLNLVVPNSAVGTVMFDGVSIPPGSFTPIGASGYSGMKLPIAIGSHSLSASLPFGCSVYGFGDFDSYGYPGGGSLSPIAQVTTLEINPIDGSDNTTINNCWDALVTDQLGNPLGGIRVDFNIVGVNSAQSGFAFTNAAGIATFCYAGVNDGLDSIFAFSGSVGDTAKFTWIDICLTVDVDDGDPCTIDACDPLTGNVTHTNSGLIAGAAITTPIACNGGTTTVFVNGFGGVPPYIGADPIPNVPAGLTSFTIVDSNGCEASVTITLIQPDKVTATVSATPTPCGFALGSATALPDGGTPGYTIEWTDINNAQVGTGNIATGLAVGSYLATVTDMNQCTGTATVVVNGIGNGPTAPSAISGPPGVCKGQKNVIYCVPPDVNIDSYVWTLPVGATGSSTGNCITVSFSTKYQGGMICVYGVNICGNSSTVCIAAPLLTTKPLKPTAINWITPVCAGTINTYCVQPISNAASFEWSIGGNSAVTILSGQGSTCIVVNVPGNATGDYEVKVKARNCKGNSDERKLKIKINRIPAMPSTITGPGTVCKNQLGFYSVTNVNNVTYNWSVTGDAWIAGGQGTNHLAIDYITSTTPSAVLSVTADNSCGSSPARTKTISINQNCRSAFNSSFSGLNGNADINLYPNPTSGNINIDFTSIAEGNCMLSIFDMTGRIVRQIEFKSVVGQNHQFMDLSDISKGAYLMRLASEDGQSIVQFFVE